MSESQLAHMYPCRILSCVYRELEPCIREMDHGTSCLASAHGSHLVSSLSLPVEPETDAGLHT